MDLSVFTGALITSPAAGTCGGCCCASVVPPSEVGSTPLTVSAAASMPAFTLSRSAAGERSEAAALVVPVAAGPHAVVVVVAVGRWGSCSRRDPAADCFVTSSCGQVSQDRSTDTTTQPRRAQRTLTMRPPTARLSFVVASPSAGLGSISWTAATARLARSCMWVDEGSGLNTNRNHVHTSPKWQHAYAPRRCAPRGRASPAPSRSSRWPARRPGPGTGGARGWRAWHARRCPVTFD